MGDGAKACAADWLALHGIDLAICTKIMSALPVRPSASSAKIGAMEITLKPEDIWQISAASIAAALPDRTANVEQTLTQTTFRYAANPTQHKRAFTLHGKNQDGPIVYCPWFGRLSDMLIIAHEFGHAFQLVASEAREMPPVARESCAFLAERWFARFLTEDDHPLSPEMAQHLQQKNASNLRKSAALLQALEDPKTPYSYNWNYPVALSLALMAETQLSDADMWRFLSGRLPLAEMIAALDI